MDDCIFCKIANEELPAFKIYDDGQFEAFLDIFPSHKGQALVIPKKHHTSKFSQTDTKQLIDLVKVAQKVARQIEENLSGVDRVQVLIEGFDVDHLHIKLFPSYGPDAVKDALSHSGDQAEEDELKQLHDQLNRT
ncbi:MAG: HIT family protein [Candidatus Dojkabacteria bacterium]